jgi:hypothetical protein
MKNTPTKMMLKMQRCNSLKSHGLMAWLLEFEGPVGLRSQPLLAATATATGCGTYQMSPTATATAADQLVTGRCQVATGSNQLQPYICTLIYK